MKVGDTCFKGQPNKHSNKQGLKACLRGILIKFLERLSKTVT